MRTRTWQLPGGPAQSYVEVRGFPRETRGGLYVLTTRQGRRIVRLSGSPSRSRGGLGTGPDLHGARNLEIASGSRGRMSCASSILSCSHTSVSDGGPRLGARSRGNLRRPSRSSRSGPLSRRPARAGSNGWERGGDRQAVTDRALRKPCCGTSNWFAPFGRSGFSTSSRRSFPSPGWREPFRKRRSRDRARDRRGSRARRRAARQERRLPPDTGVHYLELDRACGEHC